MEKGCFVVKDKEGNLEKHPLFEDSIGEIQIRSGNTVSSGALASCGFWGIDCIFLTQKGRPVAMLKSLELDDANVKTRLQQYEAYLDNEKAEYIAKQLILGKLAGQNQVLSKYGLKRHDFSIQEKIKNLKDDDKTRLRTRLMSIEGHFSDAYFSQMLSLVPNSIRPETRKTWKAFDGFNNILNLCYEVLSWKVHHALIRAKLEPYLGFLHSLAEGKPSLICDFMELYRFLIDDFVLQYCMRLHKRDFTMKYEDFSSNRKGKREYLNDTLTHDLMMSLNEYFTMKVDVSRIRMGNNQEIETLINEEALLFAQYIRNEKSSWIPRIIKF
jgi:CRISPR-associated protein Cas1